MKITQLLLLVIYLFSPMLKALERRRALVLGNDSYQGNELRNARNDAAAIASALRELGYQTTVGLDLNLIKLTQTVDKFASATEVGDITLVYYAGHGLQVDGENYLVPTDFVVADSADVKVRGYSLGALLEKLVDHGASTQVVILDACRNNPFSSDRGMSHGWARVGTSAGTLLAFGTAPGSTASDLSTGEHGLFTMSLLGHLKDPSLEIEQLFQVVRAEVIRESNGTQVPWTASSLVGQLHLAYTPDNRAVTLSQSAPVATKILIEEPSLLRAGLRTAIKADKESSRRQETLSQAEEELRAFHLEKAISLLRVLVSLDPRASLALRLLAIALHLSGRVADANVVLERAILADPADSRALSYRCLFAVEAKVADTDQLCKEALKVKADSPEAHLGLALFYGSTSDFRKANEEDAVAIQYDPKAPAAYVLQDILGANH